MTERWVQFAPEEGDWFRRHRMHFPATYVDRLMLMLTVAPLLGLVAEALALVILAELATFVAKLRLLIRLKRREGGS
jgi:hypothetical protein